MWEGGGVSRRSAVERRARGRERGFRRGVERGVRVRREVRGG